jgi:hypothetical protein
MPQQGHLLSTGGITTSPREAYVLHSPLPLRLMMQPPCEAPPSSDPHSHQTNDCYRFFKKREEGERCSLCCGHHSESSSRGKEGFSTTKLLPWSNDTRGTTVDGHCVAMMSPRRAFDSKSSDLATVLAQKTSRYHRSRRQWPQTTHAGRFHTGKSVCRQQYWQPSTVSSECGHPRR